MCHGAHVQGGQVHAQQLRNSLSAVDVTVFVQHLQMRQRYLLYEEIKEAEIFLFFF